MPWTSADTNAERAAREYVETRTPDQIRFAKSASDVQGLLVRMARYTASPSWAKDPKTVWLISDMETELTRKLAALRLDPPSKAGEGA